MVGRGRFVMVQRNGLPCLQCTTRNWFLATTNQPIFSDLKQKGQLVLHNCKMPSTIINRVTNAATNLINRNLPFCLKSYLISFGPVFSPSCIYGAFYPQLPNIASNHNPDLRFKILEPQSRLNGFF